MQRDARAYLLDARDAAGLIVRFTQGRTLPPLASLLQALLDESNHA